MPAKRVDFRSWLFRLIRWDGLLPLTIVAIPKFFTLLFPNNQDLVAMTAVLLPIVAFFWRIRVGYLQIFSNRCGYWLRRFQLTVFVVGLFPLIMIDCLLVLSNIMPKGAIFDNPDDLRICMIMVAIYFSTMVIAMYPGRSEVPADEWEQYWSTQKQS